MWLLKLQCSETEDKKKIPNAYIYEVHALTDHPCNESY